VPTTDSCHGWRAYPNLVKGTILTAPDQVWVADITYIRLPTAFIYLAAILDAYSRRCVGWALARWIDTDLTVTALGMAVARRQPAPGLIHHSDRGVQYANEEYIARLEGVGARISMTARGNPYENAKAESFFKTLKRAEVYLKEYRTFEEALMNLEAFIEEVYNMKRLHSSLGYRPPGQSHLKSRFPLNLRWSVHMAEDSSSPARIRSRETPFGAESVAQAVTIPCHSGRIA